ncbi:glycoside hydrolase superfamily [Ganoderma leucocontextum]|nr:glycoside hydrolase superfamily [Ganoderma leucocontextum]
MLLMVDVVVNHMGSATDPPNYLIYQPFPSPSFFHPECYTSPTTTIRPTLNGVGSVTRTSLCLVDLNTEDPAVVNTMNNWNKALVSNYSIDGVRIDTVKQVADYTQVLDGVLDYPAWYQLANPSGNITELAMKVWDSQARYKTGEFLVGSFLDNHDNPWFMLIRNAMAWPFVQDGIPILYQELSAVGAGPTESPTGKTLLQDILTIALIPMSSTAPTFSTLHITDHSDAASTTRLAASGLAMAHPAMTIPPIAPLPAETTSIAARVRSSYDRPVTPRLCCSRAGSPVNGRAASEYLDAGSFGSDSEGSDESDELNLDPRDIPVTGFLSRATSTTKISTNCSPACARVITSLKASVQSLSESPAPMSDTALVTQTTDPRCVQAVSAEPQRRRLRQQQRKREYQHVRRLRVVVLMFERETAVKG